MLLTDGLYYVGVNDRTKHRFEGLWSLPQGVSYNSYLLVGSYSFVSFNGEVSPILRSSSSYW